MIRDDMMTLARRKTLRIFLLLAVILASATSHALEAPAAWMRAEWSSTAPHLKDAGIDPKALGAVIGKRMLVFRHAPRNLSIPGPAGPRNFTDVRFVTAVAEVDLPAVRVRHLLRDFAGYKNVFPLMTEAETQAVDGRNVVTRYRLNMPLPIASFQVDFRLKNRLEEDGSLSSMLVDGQAESMLAMLGGMTDSLRDQPSLARWEIFPVDADHTLIAFTLWDQVQFKSWLAKMIRKEYPEMTEIMPYIAVVGALEAIRGKFSYPDMVPESVQAPGFEALQGLQPFVARFAAQGLVVVLYPEPGLREPGASGYLRYVSVAGHIQAPVEQTRTLLTTYDRLREPIPELRRIKATPSGQRVALDLKLRIGLSVIGFPLEVSLLNQWASGSRLEFHRTAGEVEKIYGACEWQAQDGGTLMLASTANVLGDDAPWLLRMFHKMVGQVPYAGDISMMVVQQIAIMRMSGWVEKQAGGSPSPAVGSHGPAHL
jgi:hypothetical protein